MILRLPRSTTAALLLGIAALSNVQTADGLTLQPYQAAPLFPRPAFRKTALRYANEASPELSSSFVQHKARPQDLVGQVILGGKYVLSRYIPVPSPKCEIYEAFQISETGQLKKSQPFIVKLSTYIDGGIDTEFANYQRVRSRLRDDQQGLFVQIYDKMDASGWTQQQAGLVMEKGSDNLRGYVRKYGAYRGDALRMAMHNVLRCVDALHSQGLVWTELKPENFVVNPQSQDPIKGIDLESLIREHDLLRVYTAEACPPEFPVDEMYKSLPEITVDTSFDMWGLGLVLFEMATGQPFYAEGLTDLEYIKDALRRAPEFVHHSSSKLQSVDSQAASIILKCLTTNPQDRPTCAQLLQHSFFAQSSSYYQVNQPASSQFDIPAAATSQPHRRSASTTAASSGRRRRIAGQPSATVRRMPPELEEYNRHRYPGYAQVVTGAQSRSSQSHRQTRVRSYSAFRKPQSGVSEHPPRIISHLHDLQAQQDAQSEASMPSKESSNTKVKPVASPTTTYSPTSSRSTTTLASSSSTSGKPTVKPNVPAPKGGKPVCWRQQLETVLDTVQTYAKDDAEIAEDLLRILDKHVQRTPATA